jgi:hypothetical protein
MAIFLMMSFDILFLKKHQGDAAVAFLFGCGQVNDFVVSYYFDSKYYRFGIIAACFRIKKLKTQQIVQNSSE